MNFDHFHFPISFSYPNFFLTGIFLHKCPLVCITSHCVWATKAMSISWVEGLFY